MYVPRPVLFSVLLCMQLKVSCSDLADVPLKIVSDDLGQLPLQIVLCN